MNHTAFRRVLAVLVTGSFFLSSGVGGISFLPQTVFAKRSAHTPSGWHNAHGGAVYTESSTTPETGPVAPIASPTVHASIAPSNTAPMTMASSNATAASTPAPQNLVPNPSLESTDTSGLPTSWVKGGYGTNTRSYAYPVSAHSGSKAAQVSITNYTSGDAKWYFTRVPVTAGQVYTFSDYSLANVPSEIDVEYGMSDGTMKYDEIATVPVNASYQQTTATFTPPAGATSVTVFHLIQEVGNLTIDDYSLTRADSTPPPPPPPPPSSDNAISNGDFETAGANGDPSGWGRGGYGTNTRSFSYPVTGVNGSKAAKVSISSYTNGDAKWYFTPITLSAGTYTYSDQYLSTLPSTIVAQYHTTSGSFTYKDLATLPAGSSFTTATVGFTVPSGTQDVTIFHVIQGVGSLTIDNASIAQDIAKSKESIFSTGAVTLTFDDGWQSQYDTALPIMDQYGLKGTFYVITRQLLDYGFSGFLSTSEIKDMYARGEDIEAHTQTHPDLPLLSPAQQQQEIAGSRQDLLAMNVGPITSFAYPYGDYDATTISIVKNAGFSSARATIDGYALPSSDHYQLPRLEMKVNTPVATAKQWIDQAIAQKAWLIISLHQIDMSGDEYSITPDTFAQVVKYLADKKVPVVTIDKGFKSLNGGSPAQ